MRAYHPSISFGHDVAESYDDYLRGDEDETVAFLDEIARGGPVLELAIGTGRIALPLATRGLQVDGIELSPAMVEQLRRKSGGDQIAVTIGDFADVPVEGQYRLIYVAANGNPSILRVTGTPVFTPDFVDFGCRGLGNVRRRRLFTRGFFGRLRGGVRGVIGPIVLGVGAARKKHPEDEHEDE